MDEKIMLFGENSYIFSTAFRNILFLINADLG